MYRKPAGVNSASGWHSQAVRHSHNTHSASPPNPDSPFFRYARARSWMGKQMEQPWRYLVANRGTPQNPSLPCFSLTDCLFTYTYIFISFPAVIHWFAEPHLVFAGWLPPNKRATTIDLDQVLHFMYCVQYTVAVHS